MSEEEEEDQEYEVEAILDHRGIRKKQYLVKWKGFDEDANTWEPPENLVGAASLLREYWEKYEAEQAASPSKKKKKSVPKGQTTLNFIKEGQPEQPIEISDNPGEIPTINDQQPPPVEPQQSGNETPEILKQKSSPKPSTTKSDPPPIITEPEPEEQNKTEESNKTEEMVKNPQENSQDQERIEKLVNNYLQKKLGMLQPQNQPFVIPESIYFAQRRNMPQKFNIVGARRENNQLIFSVKIDDKPCLMSSQELRKKYTEQYINFLESNIKLTGSIDFPM